MKISEAECRNPYKIAVFFMLLLFSVSVMAADKSRVVLHLSNQHKLHVLVNNVTNIRAAYGDRVEIIAVINGPAVTKFAKFSNTEEQIQTMLKLNTEVSVCSLAMSNKKILREQLLEGVTYLEQGGVAKLIELQEQGYSYIKI